MVMGDDCELLFFDTFSHDSCEELNLDLVQFPLPVYIFEIRVVPLGARVQADFPGGHRLGATNPSSFQLEFFVNDLSKRSASTFERLGSLEYKQNVDIQFPVPNKIPTDGLVLRGWYSAVTLAVYGVLAKTTSKDRSSPPPPPPPQPSTRSSSQELSKDFESSGTDGAINDWERNSRIPEVPPEPPPVRAHSSVDNTRFAEVPALVHPPSEQHVGYTSEIPNVIGTFPEHPPIVYQDCVPVQVPQVPATPSSYGQYDSHYQKTWSTEEQYQTSNEQYDHQLYSRPPDNTIYQPPPDNTRQLWDTKDHHAVADVSSHDHESYSRSNILEITTLHREKDKDRNRDRPWDRDLHDYKDDDIRTRDHDSKRKDRGRRSRETSWERGSLEIDRYRDRDRDRNRETSSRDRDRDRDRNRDRSFADRGNRKDIREAKRPTTPPSPRKARPRSPQTPPDEKITSGPRTPKEEEPMETFDDRVGDSGTHSNFFEPIPRERTHGDHLYNLSEGEIQEGDNTEEDDGYEEIVSEEEDMSDPEDRVVLDMNDLEYDLGDDTEFMSSFSPYNCELAMFQHFSDPSLFSFEIAESKQHITKQEETDKMSELLNYPINQPRDERWVEVLEAITEETLIHIISSKSTEKFKENIKLLVDMVVEGLDFELALNQPQTAYKVRHLKAGIRLATLLFRTNKEIIEELLLKDIPKNLLQLIDQPYMVLPVKLLILRGIDAVISTHLGMNYLVHKSLVWSPPKVFECNQNIEESKNDNELTTKTCYQKLLEILMSKQLTRAIVSLTALLNKIHLSEMLCELSDSVEKIIQNIHLPETKNAPSEESQDVSEPRAPSDEPDLEFLEVLSSSGENLVQVIVSSLQEITAFYKDAWKNLAQMKRSLPARCQFEFRKSPDNPQLELLRMFKENKLLENIFVLLSSPALSGHPNILSAIKELFQELLSSQEGILFLLSNTELINGILKALLHTVDETREEGAEESSALSLGMQIAYHLQSLLYVDSLLAYHTRDGLKKEPDDPDIVSVLHHMYTMVFTPIGRASVINVLTTAENLRALIPFVQMSGEEGSDVKQSKSVCAGYVTELLMLVIHYSEDIRVLEKFSDALFNLSQQEITPKLHDFGLWMAPTRAITSYSYESVTALMAILKAHKDDSASLHPELITALRILQSICLPQDHGADKNTELKYMYAIIQVAANDGMDSLKSILQNICDTFLKPSHQSPALSGLQGVLVVAILKPSVFVLKSLLAHLISSRGNEFKDLTAVPVLLKVYSLILLVPLSSPSYQLSQMVQAEIIEALLTYTQPFLGSAESEEALSKSLWTEMMQEILKFISLSPSNFVAGLTILSELLPLPLPLQTREALSDDEITRMINYRKLWSAHLHSLSSIIQEVIVSLAATSCHPLQQLLRRVCVQLADLAAPTAHFIVRSVLDALLETLLLPLPDQKENMDPGTSGTHDTAKPMLKTPTSTTARILNLVAYLVSHASFKIPLMHVLKGSAKADEKYIDVLPLMLELFNMTSEKLFVIQSQECIVSILQSFCDPEIGFITFENGGSVNEVLSSSLPCKEHMSQICGALVEHIGCHTHSYSSLLPSLRTLVMLTEYDYGYYYVKQGLDNHTGAIYSLFTRFSQTFSKDSSDCLSTLSTALEFLRLMESSYEDGSSSGRTLFLSAGELACLLKGDNTTSENSDKDNTASSEPFQPVLDLIKQLEEFGNDEEAVESLLESLSSLLALLNSPTPKEEKEKEIVEPVLPSPESQSAQFSSRAIFMVGEVEEGRLSPAYWLALPGADDADQEQEQVTVDLISISEKNISDFNLKTSLENLCLSTEGEDLKTKKKGISTIGGKRKYAPLINPALVDVNNKRPFIAPMRGRGFNRGNSHSSRANDPFRSRPPNTSRPPSMHVDDFLALESHHSGSGSQVQAKRPQKEGSRGRGRGFERNQVFTSTRGNGGRFFSPPGPYGRRDTNRGGNRGTSRISSNAWNNRSNQNSGQKLSPGSSQRNNFGNHRNDYNSPFNQQDTRPGQRNRDQYVEISRPSNIIQIGRFPRGSRASVGMGQQSPSHWPDNRNKSQNQRFITPGSTSRGSGRRDMNTRHNRSFTR